MQSALNKSGGGGGGDDDPKKIAAKIIRKVRILKVIKIILLIILLRKIMLKLVILAIQGVVKEVDKIKNNYKHSFLLALILNKLEVSIPKDVSPIVDYTSGILVLAIIVLFCVYNVFMYIISNWLIDNYDIEKKFSSS